MLDTFRGLPVHALVVHFAVVVGVAVVLGGLLYALVPRTRRWLSWPLAGLGVATVVLGLITPSSGEALEKRVPPSATLEHHTQLGGQLGTIMIVDGVLLVLVVLAARLAPKAADGTRRPFSWQRPLALGLTVLVGAGSLVTGVWLFRTGDAGAKAVWAGTAQAQPRPGDADGS